MGAMGKPPSPFAFVDTIDYIFTNDGDGRAAAWTVKAVGPLPSKAEAAAACESYPTADKPSNHLLLWAELAWAPTRTWSPYVPAQGGLTDDSFSVTYVRVCIYNFLPKVSIALW